MFSITLTGHRDVDYYDLKTLLDPELDKLREQHSNIQALCGGAPGGDLTFGIACLKKGIPVDLLLPDPGYEERTIQRRHPEWEQAFNFVRDNATGTYFSSQSSDWRNNFKRNEEMISPVNLVFIAYRFDDIDAYTKDTRPRKGGTAHGIMTVKKFDKPYIHLKVR